MKWVVVRPKKTRTPQWCGEIERFPNSRKLLGFNLWSRGFHLRLPCRARFREPWNLVSHHPFSLSPFILSALVLPPFIVSLFILSSLVLSPSILSPFMPYTLSLCIPSTCLPLNCFPRPCLPLILPPSLAPLVWFPFNLPPFILSAFILSSFIFLQVSYITYLPHKVVAEASNHTEPIGRECGIQFVRKSMDFTFNFFEFQLIWVN